MSKVMQSSGRRAPDRVVSGRPASGLTGRALRWIAASALVATAAWLRASELRACEAMLEGEYTDPPEILQIELEPQWDVAAQIRDRSLARKDYVRPSDTLNEWSELVSWQVTFGTRPFGLDTLQEQLLAQLAGRCESLESRVIRSDASDVVYEYWHRGCDRDGRAQHEISRLAIGVVGIHQLSYAKRGALLDAAERERWLARISQAALRLRAPREGGTPLERGRVAVWSGAYPRAVELLRPLAEAGDAAAQEELARLYVEGWGVSKDDTAALEWLRRSAAQGNLEASYQLGRMYESGLGTSVDLALAARHYEVAARGDSAEAQGHLAYLLATRSEPDYAAAARWFQRSADGGHLHAVYWLGRLHEEGHGVERSPQEAARWYARAARAGSPDAQFALGRLHALGIGVAQDDREARKWLTRAVMQGKAEARDFYRAHYRPASAPTGGG